MIYTITFNPSLDYILKVENLALGYTNRCDGENLCVGGKGINVSLILAEFGIESVALGFVGGFTGDKLEAMLANKTIMTDFVHVSGGNTRINVKLVSDEMTEVNASGPDVSDEEVDQLIKKIDNIKDGDTLVIAGSVTKNLSDSIYEKILGRLSDRKIKAVVDATGNLLLRTLKFRPFLVKPNIDELADMFKTEIACESDVVKYALELKNMGAVNVLVSMGKNGAILVDEFGKVLKHKAVGTRVINPVGAGDSMVAGFLAGAQIDYNTALAYGIAAGGATACSEGLANKALIDRFLEEMDL